MLQATSRQTAPRSKARSCRSCAPAFEPQRRHFSLWAHSPRRQSHAHPVHRSSAHGIPCLDAPQQCSCAASHGATDCFQSLADSQWVRLNVPHVAGRYEGRLLQRGPDHLVLSAEPEPLRIAATTIDTLWTRGNSGKTGAIVGAVVLGALGAVVGAAYAGGRRVRTEPDIEQGGSCLVAGGVGLAGGALLGGLIGLAIPKWHRQYP